jgi:hypothetical protein
MWAESYETDKDPDRWAEARRYGVDLPERQEHLPLAEMEELVLQEVLEFVSKHEPRLVGPLGLRLQDE